MSAIGVRSTFGKPYAVNMPAMTGVELHRRLVDAGHAIPTILVTAYPNDADRGRALNDGVVCYLRKPI
jgi:CheY-like chemotaxis protein